MKSNEVHGEGDIIAARLRNEFLEPFNDAGSVGQAGERVEKGQRVEFGVGAPAVDDRTHQRGCDLEKIAVGLS